MVRDCFSNFMAFSQYLNFNMDIDDNKKIDIKCPYEVSKHQFSKDNETFLSMAVQCSDVFHTSATWDAPLLSYAFIKHLEACTHLLAYCNTVTRSLKWFLS